MPDIGGLTRNIGGMTMGITIFITLIVVGPLVLFFVWRVIVMRRRVRESMNWERTTGTVLMSMVETRHSRSGRSGYSTSYYPKVVYEYQAMGQKYTSDRFNLGEVGLGFYNRVAAKVAEYPQGKMIDVYYNPANPVEAVLERTAPSGGWMMVVVVVIVSILLCTFAMMFGGFAFVTQFVSNFSNLMPTVPR